MGAGGLPHQWNKRLGMLSATTFSFGLATATVLVGLVLSGPGDSNQPIWLVGAFFAALWLGLQGGPLIIRVVEKAGLFGRIKIDAQRLFLNGGVSIDLEKPMAVEARYQHSTITRTYDMRDISGSRSGVGRDRKYQKGVSVFTLFVEQDGRWFVLAADETSRRPGRKYSLDGLNIRKVAISFPKGPPCARLWPADLAEILTLLQKAKGYSTALSPVPDKALEDPRQAICPAWKIVVGAAAILIVAIGLAGGILAYF